MSVSSADMFFADSVKMAPEFLRFFADVHFDLYRDSVGDNVCVCELCGQRLQNAALLRHIFEGRKHMKHWKSHGRPVIYLNTMD